ncbi:MAG TPA: PPC domain-containing protein [Kofleriaceae bacterium]
MTIARSAIVALLISFAGCGDDGGSTMKTPDAFIIVDQGIDARACTGVTAGTLDFLTYDPQGFIAWEGPLMGDLGDGNTLVYRYEIYNGIEASLSGTFDLKAGNQANYKTCAICVRAFSVNAMGEVVKQFFQSGGSVTITQDPYATKHLKATFTDLQLEEVTINQQDFTSTPVAGGGCTSFPSSFMVDRDRVPSAWTCTRTEFDSGTNCDCMCGVSDPDCSIATAPVVGCTTGQACFANACVTPPTNDTCATATALTLGTPVMGNTAGGGRNYNMGLEGATCTDFPQPGSDVAYSVALTAGQVVTVTLSGVQATYDAAVALVGPGAPTICDAMPITTCVAGADAMFDGQNETFMFTVVTAGTYYVIVDSYSTSEAGSFTLTVTAQ